MVAIDWDLFIAWLLAPGFGLLALLYIYQRGWRRFNQNDWLYLAYLGLSLLWGLGVLFAHPRIRDLAFFVPFEHLAPYFLAASPCLLLLITPHVARHDQPRWRWELILPALLFIVAALHDVSFRPNLADTLLLGARKLDRDGLWRLILLTANLIPLISALQSSLELHDQGWGIIYRNRLRYWSLALSLIALGDLSVILFAPTSLVFYLGGLTQLGSTTLALATLIIPYLPTINTLLRHALIILVTGLVTMGILAGGILTTLAILPQNEQQAIIVGSAVVSALLALLYTPLQQSVHRMINKLTLRHQTDLQNVLAEYHHCIRRELDLEELAKTIIDLLDEALDLKAHTYTSALTVVQVTDQGGIEFTPIPLPGTPALPRLYCQSDSPLTQYWQAHSHQLPLAQYDIEVLPDFKTVSERERERLAHWGSALYVPLHSAGCLVGMLALGHKQSGAAYNAPEIRFLQTLTAQTVVALEQAQLLSNLKIANAQLTNLSDELAQANRRLYEANRLKSGFIGVITHELRSPFVSIDFSLQIIERYGLSALSTEQREQFKTLKKGIVELKQMIDNIIAFASLLSKQGKLDMERVDLGQIILETVESIKPIAQARQIKVDVLVWPDLPAVWGDRERLSEAIYHLTHNAIKFNQPGGWVHVRCQPQDDSIDIWVQDNGIGVPAEKLDHLWNEFTQMADPLRRGVEGMGLGLALVRYVAIAHDGEVWAESVEGKGSTFGFKMPVLQDPPSPTL